jgi:hypothetical protein
MTWGLAQRVVAAITTMIKEVPTVESMMASEVLDELNRGDDFRALKEALDARNEDLLSRPGVSVPTAFLCPITRFIMDDPVMAEDGHIYERKAIEAWFATRRQAFHPLTSPMSRAVITEVLVPQVRLANDIRAFIASIPPVS